MPFQANQRLKESNFTMGKKAVNALYPNEIELYICAFELVDSMNRVVEYFLFPINPSSISELEATGVNIKKTAGGITVLNHQTFIPTEISLIGDFGRQFKFILGQDLISFSAMLFSTSGGIFKNVAQQAQTNFQNGIFSRSIKTGYGCIKIVEAILNKSVSLDSNGQPYSLYFYNLALGNNYLVKLLSMTFSMSEERNMIWKYNISLKSLAPLEQIQDLTQNQANSQLSFNDTVQKNVNAQFQNLVAML